jgi:hypothetical protein
LSAGQENSGEKPWKPLASAHPNACNSRLAILGWPGSDFVLTEPIEQSVFARLAASII